MQVDLDDVATLRRLTVGSALLATAQLIELRVEWRDAVEPAHEAHTGATMDQLIELLVGQENIATLDRPDDASARVNRLIEQLVELLVGEGDVAALERRIARDRATLDLVIKHLVASLVERGDVSALERLADAGNEHAAERLTNLRSQQSGRT